MILLPTKKISGIQTSTQILHNEIREKLVSMTLAIEKETKDLQKSNDDCSTKVVQTLKNKFSFARKPHAFI